MTVRSLIQQALRLCGALSAPGRSAADSEHETEALDVLNALLGSWNAERLNIYTISAATYPLVSNQQAYTIGQDPAGILTADFNAPRPQEIQQANIILTGSSAPLHRPLKPIGDQEWANIRIQEIWAIPQKLYNDGAYPLSTLYLWPGPGDSTYELELYTWQALSTFASIDDAVTLPPGYDRALIYNLAVELSPRYPRAPMSPLVMKTAIDSKAAIQRRNINPAPISCDPALMSSEGTRRSWNYLTGEF